MSLQQGQAYPIRGYNLITHPKQPTIAILMFDTEAGPQLFAANREILEALAAAFRQQAEMMPSKANQN
jgi:hypothetical protein